jgi:hypothetical protein
VVGHGETYSWALRPFSKFLKKCFDLIFYFLLLGSAKGLNYKIPKVMPGPTIRVHLLKFYQSTRRQGTSGGIWRSLQLSPETIFEIFECFDLIFYFLQGSVKGLNYNTPKDLPRPTIRVHLLKSYQSPRRQGTSGGIWHSFQLRPKTLFRNFWKCFDLIFHFLLRGSAKGLNFKYRKLCQGRPYECT